MQCIFAFDSPNICNIFHFLTLEDKYYPTFMGEKTRLKQFVYNHAARLWLRPRSWDGPLSGSQSASPRAHWKGVGHPALQGH